MATSNALMRYKVVLVGDGGVGKSTYIKRHLTGEFEKEYIPTLGVDVTPLMFKTNYGDIIFDIWDTAGQEKFGGLRDGYYIQAKGCIVMFDLSSIITYKNAMMWYENVERVTGNIPTVFCGNKYDSKNKVVMPIDINIHRDRGKYYDISAKSNYNLEKPFLELARRISNHMDLEFIPHDAKIPPTVLI